MTKKGLNVLMFSTDANILVPGSPVARRMARYGSLFNRLTIVVLGVGSRTVIALSENTRAVFPGGRNKRDAYKNSFWESMREGREMSASIVTAQDPFFVGFVGWRVAAALHIPLQSQIHTDAFNYAYFLSSARHFFEIFIAFFVLLNSSCVRVVSRRIAKRLWFVPSAKVNVLPIMVSAAVPTSPIPIPKEFVSERRIIMVSRFEAEKQIHIAIDAMLHLEEHTHLYLIGTGSYEKILRKKVRMEGLEERVHFLGWQEDLSAYYAHADIFLQVSKYEGYGRSLIEAGLHSCALVSTDVGVVGDVLVSGESIMVVKPDAQDVATGLSFLLHNENVRDRFAKSAKESCVAHRMSEEVYYSMYKASLEHCGA